MHVGEVQTWQPDLKYQPHGTDGKGTYKAACLSHFAQENLKFKHKDNPNYQPTQAEIDKEVKDIQAFHNKYVRENKEKLEADPRFKGHVREIKDTDVIRDDDFIFMDDGSGNTTGGPEGAAPPGTTGNQPPVIKDQAHADGVTGKDATKTADLNKFLGGVDGFNGMDKDMQNKTMDSWKTAYGEGKDPKKVEDLGKFLKTDGFQRLPAGEKHAALDAANKSGDYAGVSRLTNDLGFQGMTPQDKNEFLGKYGSDKNFRDQVNKMMDKESGHYHNADVGVQTNALKHMKEFAKKDEYNKLPDDAKKQNALEVLWTKKLFDKQFNEWKWDQQVNNINDFVKKNEHVNWKPDGPVAVNADKAKIPDEVKLKDGAKGAYTAATSGGDGSPDPTQAKALNDHLKEIKDDFNSWDEKTQAAYIKAYNKSVEGRGADAAKPLKELVTNDKFKGLKPEQKEAVLNTAAESGAAGTKWAMENVPDFASKPPALQKTIVDGYNKANKLNTDKKADDKTDYVANYKDWIIKADRPFQKLSPEMQQKAIQMGIDHGFPQAQTLTGSPGFQKMDAPHQAAFVDRYNNDGAFRTVVNEKVLANNGADLAKLSPDQQARALTWFMNYVAEPPVLEWDKGDRGGYGELKTDGDHRKVTLEKLWGDELGKKDSNFHKAGGNEDKEAEALTKFFKDYFVGDSKDPSKPNGPGKDHLK